MVAEIGGLERATRRVVTGIEIEHHILLADLRREVENFHVGIRQ